MKEIVAGVDGCKKGWFCVTKNLASGEVKSAVYSDAEELLCQQPEPLIIAIDIPIGLTEEGPRICDIEARKIIGKRRSSVFPAPIRPVLKASTREEADSIGRGVDGRGVPAQAFGIYRKILEIDTLLSGKPHLQQQIREVHPELCFWALNDEREMSYNKRTKEGRAERRGFIDKHFGARIIDEIRAEYRIRDVAHDDIYDGFAALWTAERILTGKAGVIPVPSPRDVKGFYMQMWY